MISTVVLTHNSKDSLEATLQSVLFSDEILVIDDFSTDDTNAIAKKYSAKIFMRHLDDDFSAQRNFGLEKAKGEWVLFIDSDEVVPPALQKEIRDTISRQESDKEGIQGWYIKRDDMFLGKKLRFGETKNVSLLRLARKGAGVWKRPVHEYWDIQGKTKFFANPLFHNAHSNVTQFIDDINTYTTINAQYLKKEGVRSNQFSIIIYPLAKFILNYFLRLGFLDGTQGAVMAIMMSFHSFLTRAKLYLLTRDR